MGNDEAQKVKTTEEIILMGNDKKENSGGRLNSHIK